MPPPKPDSAARSATRPRRSTATHGFLIPPKPRRRPVSELSVSELKERHEDNERLLLSPGPSSSGFVQRISLEQAEIQSRLVDLVGVEGLRSTLQGTHLDADGSSSMMVDGPKPISAKQRALEQFAARTGSKPMSIPFDEAEKIEQDTLAAERKRNEAILQKRRKQGLAVPGEILTREEQATRMWAFLNYKPTDSDLEDDDEDEDEDDADDPSSWFEDEDGRKGQDIVDPDEADDISNIIRVDESRLPLDVRYREHT